MQAIADRSGKKYGHLTLLYCIRGNGAGKGATWMALCDCGNKKEVDGRAVKKGRIKTCGKCEYYRRLLSTRPATGISVKSAERDIYRRYAKVAHKKGLPFELDLPQFIDLIHKNCVYCGVEPRQKVKDSKLKYNGIDRIDNDKGYTLENSRSCCGTCNRMKSSSNYIEFLEHVYKIANHIESQRTKKD